MTDDRIEVRGAAEAAQGREGRRQHSDAGVADRPDRGDPLAPARDVIAIFGASGHTGRLVAGEVLSRGEQPLLLGRSRERLEALAGELPQPARWIEISLDDAGRLREALADTRAVINCAGPFSRTAQKLAAAAIDAGTHYVDVSAEPPAMKQLAEAQAAKASRARVALVGGAGFYFVLSECLTRLLAETMGPCRRVTVGYLVEGWLMTRASRAAALLLMEQPRLIYAAGRLGLAPAGQLVSSFDFPAPHGRRQVIAYPGGEVLTIPRHTPTEEVRVVMTSGTFRPETFSSDDASPAERARSNFVVAVEAESSSRRGRAWAAGRDIYKVGAVTVVETALRLTDPTSGRDWSGALAPAEVLDPSSLIRRLAEEGLVSETCHPAASHEERSSG